MAEESKAPLGEDTVDYLEDAKKGKPRSFLIICKASDVVYLKVGKKPVKPTEAAEAKSAGHKGDAYYGVITGKGVDLVFNLALADGYKDAPVTDKKLREFVVEHTKLKLKPTFAIVASQPPIPEDDAGPGQPVAGPGGSSDEALAALNKIRPEVELALKNNVGDKSMAETLAQAQQRLDSGDAAGVLELCRQMTSQLNDEWRRLAKVVLPRVQAIFNRPFTEQAGDVDRIRAVVNLAKERAAEERFGSAAVALVRMTPLLDQAEQAGAPKAADVITPGRVAQIRSQLEKARVRWDAGIQEALKELQKVQDGIQEVDDEFSQALPAILRGYERELMELLTTAHKAEGEQSSALKSEALQMAKKLHAEVDNDEFLAFMDVFPNATVKLQDTLANALSDVEMHLRA